MRTCPDWLGRDLLAGGLPWAAALPASLPPFLERYALDGAVWIGLYAEPDRCATLLLHWEERGRPADAPPGAAILAVRFESLERSDVHLRGRAIAAARSGPTSRAADHHRTQLTDRHGGEATLVHSPAVRLLCLSPSREPLPLLVPAETV